MVDRCSLLDDLSIVIFRLMHELRISSNYQIGTIFPFDLRYCPLGHMDNAPKLCKSLRSSRQP